MRFITDMREWANIVHIYLDYCSLNIVEILPKEGITKNSFHVSEKSNVFPMSVLSQQEMRYEQFPKILGGGSAIVPGLWMSASNTKQLRDCVM